MTFPDDALVSKFWQSIEKSDGQDGCWLWTGPTSNEYGTLNHRGHRYGAHRLSWHIDQGKAIPDGMCVCHRCDTPICVNPRHLWLGTHKDNSQDFVSKGWRDVRLRLTSVFWSLPVDERKRYRGLIHWCAAHPDQIAAARSFIAAQSRLLLSRATTPTIIDGSRRFGVWELNQDGHHEAVDQCIGTVLNFGKGEPVYRQCKRKKGNYILDVGSDLSNIGSDRPANVVCGATPDAEVCRG